MSTLAPARHEHSHRSPLTTLSVRPLAAGESGPLRTVFDRMSHRSRYFRYLTGTPRLTPSMLRVLTDVGHARHLAWAAEVDGVPVGIARLIRPDVEGSEAEVALEVADEHHGRGIGTALLAVVRQAAAASGVSTLVWTASAENDAVRRLLAGSGSTVRWVDGVLEGRMPVAPAGS